MTAGAPLATTHTKRIRATILRATKSAPLIGQINRDAGRQLAKFPNFWAPPAGFEPAPPPPEDGQKPIQGHQCHRCPHLRYQGSLNPGQSPAFDPTSGTTRRTEPLSRPGWIQRSCRVATCVCDVLKDCGHQPINRRSRREAASSEAGSRTMTIDLRRSHDSGPADTSWLASGPNREPLAEMVGRIEVDRAVGSVAEPQLHPGSRSARGQWHGRCLAGARDPLDLGNRIASCCHIWRGRAWAIQAI